MVISKDYILREIAGDFVVVPTGRAVFQFQGLITLNEVGKYLWELLQKQNQTVEQLAQQVCREYEVEETVARQDVEEFVQALESRGILTEK